MSGLEFVNAVGFIAFYAASTMYLINYAFNLSRSANRPRSQKDERRTGPQPKIEFEPMPSDSARRNQKRKKLKSWKVK